METVTTDTGMVGVEGSLVSVLATQLLIHIPHNMFPERRQRMAQLCGFWPPMWEAQMLSPGCCKNWRSEPAEGSSLTPSLFLLFTSEMKIHKFKIFFFNFQKPC